MESLDSSFWGSDDTTDIFNDFAMFDDEVHISGKRKHVDLDLTSLLDVEPNFKKHSSSDISSSSSKWSHDEEILLLGVVIDSALVLGSEQNWKIITACYDEALKNFNAMSTQKYSERTKSALKKHHGVMYRLKKANDSWFQVYHSQWGGPRFNCNFQLLSHSRVLEIKVSI